jgi:maleate isomerase
MNEHSAAIQLNNRRSNVEALNAESVMSYGAFAASVEPAAVRARLGIILPSVNTIVEPWFNSVLPSGVSLHATRMLLSADLTPAALRSMDEEEGLASALRLRSCRPSVIAYGCTASSVVQGMTYDLQMRSTLEDRTRVPCFTAVGAIIAALRLLGARRLVLASPYSSEIDALEHAFFVRAGFAIAGGAHLGINDGFALASPNVADIYALVMRAMARPADAVVISCLNMNSHVVAAALEDATGLPVVTSTTCVLWKLLRTSRIDDRINGYGRLLEMH